MKSTEQIIKVFQHLARPLLRRVSLMVGRAVVEMVNNDLKCQGLQLSVLADEVHDDVEHFEHYGFTSVARSGAEALLLSPGGQRANGIAVCVTDRRYRPTDLVEGEVAMYTDEGKQVHCKRGGEVVVGTNATEYAARADRVDAELTAFKADLDGLKLALVAHTHVFTAVVAGGVLATTLTSPAFASYTPHTPSSTEADKVMVE